MKINKISLKWKLFGYILIFASSIVLLFALFQIFLLDDFYRYIKTRDINSLTINVTEEMETSLRAENISLADLLNADNDLTQELTTISNDKEASIYVFSNLNNGEYELLYRSSQGASYNRFCLTGTETNDPVINEIWQKALLESGNNGIFYVIFTENSDAKFQIMVTPDSKNQVEDSLICGKYLINNGQRYMIIVDSRLTPVGPAVDTMKTQILYISLIIVVLTILVAFLLSKSIAKPIITINNSAKELAKGNYNVQFNGQGYSEITDLNDTLNYTAEELKKAETLQRELLANVSHDLRTPLTLISGYAEMMRDIPSENTKENAQIIIDESNRLSILVNDLLNLSRIKARTVPLDITRFSVNELLTNIVNRQNKLLESTNMTINLVLTEEVYVKADLHKIEQVIYNFINNAINYSGDSHIVDVIEEIKDHHVVIKIRDYGVGIKQENLEFIWKRYFRVDKGLQRSTQGSGLGLSIIKEILEYHGFTYGVESIIDQGSTFYFSIPIDQEK